MRRPGFAPFLLFDPPADAGLSADGRVLVVNRVDGPLVMIETATDRVLRSLNRVDREPNRLAVSPDGHTLAWGGGSRDPEISLLEMATGGERLSLSGHTGRVLSLSFSADGRHLLSGSEDGTACSGTSRGRPRPRRKSPLGRRSRRVVGRPGPGRSSTSRCRRLRSLAASPKSSVPFLRTVFVPAAHVGEEQNIRADYRTGIGRDGQARQGQDGAG